MSHRADLVHVAVLNYCAYEDTIACVASLRASRGANWRLCVVDNGSPDGSGAALARAIPPDELVQLRRNTGYVGGNNVVIRRAIAEGAGHVLIVNPDVRVSPSGVRHYVEMMARDPRIGALNAIQVGEDGRTIDPSFRSAVLVPRGYTGRELGDDALPPLFETEMLLGAALMLRVEAIQRVGTFDPLFFAYGEENDLCRRMRWHRWTLAVTAGEPVIHLRTRRRYPSETRIRFLRLKGILLYHVKAAPSFRDGLRYAFGQLSRALAGRPSDEYPFDRYRFTHRELALTALWLGAHALQIRAHRRLDRRGSAYLS